MAATKVGRNCSVRIGTKQTLGIGTWTISGIDADVIEDTEFGDTYKTYVIGFREGGNISFSGHYDPTDASGQDVIRTAWENATEVTSLRLYVDSTSYWLVSDSIGGLYITSWEVSADKADIARCSFTAKVSGLMELH